jgi:hypothetical protein
VEDGSYPIGQAATVDQMTELIGLHEVAETEIAQIAEVVTEAVNNENLVFALRVKRLDQIAADKAGATGYDDHRLALTGRGAPILLGGSSIHDHSIILA